MHSLQSRHKSGLFCLTGFWQTNLKKENKKSNHRHKALSFLPASFAISKALETPSSGFDAAIADSSTNVLIFFSDCLQISSGVKSSSFFLIIAPGDWVWPCPKGSNCPFCIFALYPAALVPRFCYLCFKYVWTHTHISTQFQHNLFKFQVQFQHTHTHTLQLQFQHTHSRCSFNTHISTTVEIKLLKHCQKKYSSFTNLNNNFSLNSTHPQINLDCEKLFETLW